MRGSGFGRRGFLGALGISGIAIAIGMSASPVARAIAGARAYVGCFTTGGQGRGIMVTTVDPGSGRLTMDSTIETTDPTSLAMSPDGRFLYAVNESDGAGTATAIDLTTQPPTVLNTVAVEGNRPIDLCVTPDGRWLLTANYESGSVTVLAIAADGSIGDVTDVAQHSGSGPNERQKGPHARQVHVDPSGNWILATDLGADSVFVYQLADGKLSQQSQATLRPGSGPNQLCFHPDGRSAYLVSELAVAVTVCDWNADRGELRPGFTIGTADPTGLFGNYAAAPVVSPDGRYLYVANCGHDNIAAFAVSGATLTLLGRTLSGARRLYGLTISPDGRRLYAAHRGTNTVTWLDLDPSTGLPGPASKALDAPSATTVLFG
ncbi:lactonase family protein [Nocardia arthritidis]|uniref:Beta-propeller fold lactonase family protein n=1 Tax=Nocardia arthritidis TaxID=228602 RepID=A0A6G9YHU5_9NOCA|nr:lactonase family protein [Nocardia arthritidis]QIS12754.1 beta-propeller fold lactonase family protein [Nocardia arthritidis]